MKENNKINFINKQFSNNIKEKKNISSPEKGIILNSYKSSLKKTLSLIKKLQCDFITNTESVNNNLSKLKKCLIIFKDNLNSSLNEKQKKCQHIKTQIESKKNEIQTKLFSSENNNMVYYSDTNKLKILNFEIENKINSIDNEISFKNEIITSNSLFKKGKKEINFIHYDKKILNVLDNNKIIIQKQLIDTTKLIEQKKKEIDKIMNTILYLKNLTKNNIYKIDINNKNKKNLNQNNYEYTTTATINNDNNIDKKMNKDSEHMENVCALQSFHSSLYSSDRSCSNQNQDFYLTKNNKTFEGLNLSNDYINTDNSNNISNKTIFNNIISDRPNLDENYIIVEQE